MKLALDLETILANWPPVSAAAYSPPPDDLAATLFAGREVVTPLELVASPAIADHLKEWLLAKWGGDERTLRGFALFMARRAQVRFRRELSAEPFLHALSVADAAAHCDPVGPILERMLAEASRAAEVAAGSVGDSMPATMSALAIAATCFSTATQGVRVVSHCLNAAEHFDGFERPLVYQKLARLLHEQAQRELDDQARDEEAAAKS